MPEYLMLCMKSWELNVPDAEIIHLDIENISDFIKSNVKDLLFLSPAQRSDVAMAAVMSEGTGLFLDVDTIILPWFDVQIFKRRGKPTFYGSPTNISTSFLFNDSHESALLSYWKDVSLRRVKNNSSGIASVLRRFIRSKQGKNTNRGWDFFANSILEREDAIRLQYSISLRDPVETGYLLYDVTSSDPRQTFIDKFCDGGGHETHTTDMALDGVVALQNSWVPLEIKRKSSAEILNDTTFMSYLLRLAVRHEQESL